MSLPTDITITDNDSNTYNGSVVEITIDNFKINVALIMSLTDAENLRENIYPGKVKKIDLLTHPCYVDSTYTGNNTITISITGPASNIWSGGNLVIESYSKEAIGRPPAYAKVELSGYEVCTW